MKNKLTILCLILLTACSKPKATIYKLPTSSPTSTVESVPLLVETPMPTNNPSIDSEVLVISEKLYLTQINDVFFNFDDYKDKTIYIEGMYSVFTSTDGTKTSPVVFRYGPGCCGNDGWGGFLLEYDGELPKENDWIAVTGTPKIVTDGVYSDLYLVVENIEIKQERGSEYVTH